MANRTLEMNDAVYAYLLSVGAPESKVLARLREETAKLPMSAMQIGPEQGAFMAWLAGTLGVKRAVEVGTFTGYSAICVASALPPEGRLVCCDVSEEYTAIARRYFAEAGLADRIDLRIAPAIETLAALRRDGEGSYDFAFIDADKKSYDAYYESCLALLRAGGTIAIDNVLWGGRVADANENEESTVALRALNAKVAADRRVRACMIPVGDGITLVRKL
jgi:predicted O-methyltransferase YrrM